jgi:hypothetical protein
MLKRNRKVTFRLTDKEFDRLHGRAHRARLSQEAYLRQLINGYVPKDAPPPDYYQMMRELAAIGNNLNQLTRAVNATGSINAHECSKVLTTLDEAIRQITQKVTMPERMPIPRKLIVNLPTKDYSEMERWIETDLLCEVR